MPLLAPIALSAITASLLALPVTPALLELRQRLDAAPLPVSRHNGRIENFAETFRSRLEPLRPQLAACRLQNDLSRVSIHGLDVLLVGLNDFNFDPALIRSVAAVMFAGPAVIPPAALVNADIYAEDTLELSEGAALRAAFASGNITLGENSSVLRWLHSHTGVLLKPGSAAQGRLSAAQRIALSSGCYFQRVHAPQILTVANRELSSASGSVAQTNRNQDANQKHKVDLPVEAASLHSRRRIHGDFVLPDGEFFATNIVATGKVRIGCGACLSGSVKGHRDVVIEEGASISGSVVSERSVHLGSGCFVTGPIMAETGVEIGQGSQIGELDSPTTVSSTRIQIAPHCQIHGTIWAREQGSIGG
jgi:cytoskeletal protein CcmA (bactofilin family)